MEYTSTHAEFSDDRKYRYTLERRWGLPSPTIMFICLNPSTADEKLDDPTIRRCVGFSDREGFQNMILCNIFAFRATDPKDMKAAEYPIGADNDMWIKKIAKDAKKIVLAWGTHGDYLKREDQVVAMLRTYVLTLNLLGKPLYCLGTTINRHPKHPLYLAKNTSLIEYKY